MSETETVDLVLASMVSFLSRTEEASTQQTGSAEWVKPSRIYKMVEARFQDKGTYFRQTLQRFAENPETRLASMREALAEVMADDAAFTRELSVLVEPMSASDDTATFTTIVEDGGSIGQVANIQTVHGPLSLSNGLQSDHDFADAELPDRYGTLRTKLNRYFSIDELKSLCFDMGVEDENLPQNTKNDLIRALIRYCHHSDQIAKLVARCGQLRPVVTQWMDEKA